MAVTSKKSDGITIHLTSHVAGWRRVQGGTIFGATDEDGYFAVKTKVHVHDLHATILHLLGLDHTKLTYLFSGRNMRLTDVHGRVVREILGLKTLSATDISLPA